MDPDMPVRSSQASWNGDLREGDGTMTIGDGVYEGGYSFASRFQEGEGTNPEELIGAAHAGCFSMALANGLAEDGHEPETVNTTARVHLEDGTITEIELIVEGTVPGIDDQTFREYAEDAKENCPVSRALGSVETITVDASLAN